MNSLRIALSSINKWLKVRYPLIMVGFLTLSLVLPYFFPYYRDFNPVYSINNQGNYGHSLIADQLSETYEVKEVWNDIETIEFKQNDALVIITPQLSFSSSEKDLLFDLAFSKNIPILIFGNTIETIELMTMFEFYAIEDSSGTRIYDFEENLDNDPAYPIISGSFPHGGNINPQEFVSVTPTQLEIYANTRYNLVTQSTSEIGQCISNIGEGCSNSFIVGSIHSYWDIAVVSDNWLLSNFVVARTEMNTDLIPHLLAQMDRSDVSTLYFEESHYEWAPVNQRGVTMFVEKQLNVGLISIVIALLTIILPLLLLYSSGDRKDKEVETVGTSNIKARLNYIHLERLPAAPLSLEEKTLVDEKLEHQYRGKYYFQYVAAELYEIIENNDFEPHLEHDLLNHLRSMRYNLISNSSAWSIIKAVNSKLEELMEQNPDRKWSEYK